MQEIDDLPKYCTFDPNHFQKLSNQIKSNNKKKLLFYKKLKQKLFIIFNNR